MSGDHNMYQKPRSYVGDDTQYDEAQVQAMIKKAVLEERKQILELFNKEGLWDAEGIAHAIRARVCNHG